MKKIKRPRGITIISIWFLIVALLGLIRTSNLFDTITSLLFAFLNMVTFYGLWKLKKFGLYLALIGVIVGIAQSIFTLINPQYLNKIILSNPLKYGLSEYYFDFYFLIAFSIFYIVIDMIIFKYLYSKKRLFS
jgi:hypothetical protein